MCTSAFIDEALSYPESFQLFLWHCRDGRVLTYWQQKKAPTLTSALRAVSESMEACVRLYLQSLKQCPRSSSHLFHCRLE